MRKIIRFMDINGKMREVNVGHGRPSSDPADERARAIVQLDAIFDNQRNRIENRLNDMENRIHDRRLRAAAGFDSDEQLRQTSEIERRK